MTFNELIMLIGKISYPILIVASLFFGISLALQIYISSAVKKVLKNSRGNFDNIKNEKAKQECLKAISIAKDEAVCYFETQAKLKKERTKNKVKKAFKITEKQLIDNEINLKEVFLDLFKGTAGAFSNYGGKERGYLSFTEREIFSVLSLLRERLENIIDSSGVYVLKSVNISTFIIALNFYKSLEKIKNNLWVTVVFWLVDFFLWFGRVFSPNAITKFLLKEFAHDNLSLLISKAMVEVCGKELAYIYYEKSLLQENAQIEEIA